MSEPEKVNIGTRTTPDIGSSFLSQPSSTDIENSNFIDPIKIKDTDTSSTNSASAKHGIAEPSKKNLYKLKSEGHMEQVQPSKIEFKLYRPRKIRYQTKVNSPRRPKATKSCPCVKAHSKDILNREQLKEDNKEVLKEKNTFLTRLQNSFQKMRRNSLSKPNNENSSENKLSTPRTNENIDFYYFDHGSFEYFRTTDCPPNILSEILGQQTTYYATRFWAEIFGSIHIGVAFFITFFLQTYRFALYSIIRPIIVGFLQMTSDYLFKPIMTTIFNGIVQPPLIFLFNIFSSIKDMLEPIAMTCDNFFKPIERILKAIRLISFNNENKHSFVKEV